MIVYSYNKKRKLKLKNIVRVGDTVEWKTEIKYLILDNKLIWNNHNKRDNHIGKTSSKSV